MAKSPLPFGRGLVVSLPALNRNPFYDVSGHLLFPPVVKPGRSRLCVPGQVLHALERDALPNPDYSNFAQQRDLG
jgi:hypothetical protein